MNIRLRYFASLREALGANEVIDLPVGSNLGDLRDLLLARGGAHAVHLARGRAVRAAVNQALAEDESTVLAEGAEVAFFPPVTGG